MSPPARQSAGPAVSPAMSGTAHMSTAAAVQQPGDSSSLLHKSAVAAKAAQKHVYAYNTRQSK